MSKIFINYRRDDTSGYAGRMYDRLAKHFGADQIFMDIEHIDPGADFVEVINENVAACRALIVLIGPQWLTISDEAGGRRLDDPKDFVRVEVATALKRNARVIPVLLKGAAMPRAQELPEPLALLSRRQAVAITDTRFHQDVDGLIECIEKTIGAGDLGRSAASAESLATGSMAGEPGKPAPAVSTKAVDSDADKNLGSAPAKPQPANERSQTRSNPVSSIGVILVLSLVTWWYFYVVSMPLDPGATLVVVGAWVAIVMLGRRIWAARAKTDS
ncbi:MAG: toll/interleukin-1 receptor domain-containing protein [Candidatus Binatia bacterium]